MLCHLEVVEDSGWLSGGTGLVTGYLHGVEERGGHRSGEGKYRQGSHMSVTARESREMGCGGEGWGLRRVSL